MRLKRQRNVQLGLLLTAIVMQNMLPFHFHLGDVFCGICAINNETSGKQQFGIQKSVLQ